MNNYRISNSANSPVQLNMEAEVTTPQRTAKRNVRFAVRLPKRGGSETYRKLPEACLPELAPARPLLHLQSSRPACPNKAALTSDPLREAQFPHACLPH